MSGRRPGPARRSRPRPAPGLEMSGAAMRAATDLCSRFAIRHILSLGRQPSWNTGGGERLARTFREPPPEKGMPLAAILPRLAGAVERSFTTPGPGYLAYIPGGGIYPSALGDYLALALNRYVGVRAAAPALAQIEMTVIDWLRRLVAYPARAQGLLTSGGSMSNLIALVTARRDRLPADFLKGVIYLSNQTHHSVAKAALLAGFSGRNLRTVPVDARLRMRPEALEAAIRADRRRGLRPFVVVASAGTTNTGAVDPVPEIAGLCGRYRIWLHVDAAYGGFFRMAPGGRRLLPGLERADSLVLDPHKGLFLPYGTGCLLVRDPEALCRAHQLDAGYLQDLRVPAGVFNFADLSPELSREFRGLRLWLPFKMFGAAAFRDHLREKLDLARWAFEELRGDPAIEWIDEPQLSIVAFRFRPPRGRDADRFNRRVLDRVNGERRVFLSSTTIGGRFTLRICVLSFRTHADRVAMAVEGIRRALRAA